MYGVLLEVQLLMVGTVQMISLCRTLVSWKVIIIYQGAELVDGEIKVRQNDAWGLNYGDDGNDGLMEVNGANIPVSAGIYNIILNMAANPPTIEMYQW